MTYLIHIFRPAIWGLAFSALAVVGVGVYALVGGPIPNSTNWVGLAEFILVVGFLVLGASAAIARDPNPYTRTYKLYDLSDVPPEHQTLDSGSADLLWNLVPIIIAIAILAKFVVLR